jgi:hypothetical protein
MIVRIRFKVGPPVVGERNLESKMAAVLSTLLPPSAVLCFAIALWRLLEDVNVTEAFAFRAGLLSHWQVWLASGILLQTLSVYMGRYVGRSERDI